jgi:sodium/potassium/calcium exchanger 6
MVSAFWAFVVVWDGVIGLWETLGFLFLYLVYICVVIFGRLVNQKIKLSKGIITKNDFTKNVGKDSNNTRTKSLKSIHDSYNGEDDRTDAEDIEGQRRPLLSQDTAAINVERETETGSTDEEALVEYKSEFRASCWPVDMFEWRESNVLNKAMIVVKTPVFYLLKMSIPLVDYDIAKSNWNKVTILINCVVAPIFIVFATQVANDKLLDTIPVWALAIIVGLTLALLVFFFTDLQNEPKFYWVEFYLFIYRSNHIFMYRSLFRKSCVSFDENFLKILKSLHGHFRIISYYVKDYCKKQTCR